MAKVFEMDSEQLREFLLEQKKVLNEKQYRRMLGRVANMLGRGGQSRVSQLTGAARSTIRRGSQEVVALDDGWLEDDDRVRASGGGRPSAVDTHPELLKAVQQIADSEGCGKLHRSMSWTTLSLRRICAVLKEKNGIQVSPQVVGRALDALGYRRQYGCRIQKSMSYEGRRQQFQFIESAVDEYLEANEPAVLLSMSWLGLVQGLTGAERSRIRESPQLAVEHAPFDAELCRAPLYGVHVADDTMAFFNLGKELAPLEAAVDILYAWWLAVGMPSFPDASRLLVVFEGNSDGPPLLYWKERLAVLSELMGLTIQIAHCPPGCCRFNVMHRLFGYTPRRSTGLPFVTIATVVGTIGAMDMDGSAIHCRSEVPEYGSGVQVPISEFEMVDVEGIGGDAQGMWNYLVRGFRAPSGVAP